LFCTPPLNKRLASLPTPGLPGGGTRQVDHRERLDIMDVWLK
jgi:hypothetical protein